MLRRPPTAIALRASDITELESFINDRNAAASATASGSSKDVNNDKDMILEREEKERKRKEAKSVGERIGV